MFVGVETDNVFDSQRIGAYVNMLENGEVTTKLWMFLRKIKENQEKRLGVLLF